ncbi:MAG: hypothetical protein Kow0098_00660 [Ignavibacteriaceae bacterium]
MKTKPNNKSVEKFLNNVTDKKKKEDSFRIMQLMKSVTKTEPKMWGESIVGFGSYHYKYESGREGDWFLTGFSPRKQNLTLYITAGFREYEDMLKKLGKFKTGKSCLYINRLEDIDIKVLTQLVKKSVEKMSAKK